MENSDQGLKTVAIVGYALQAAGFFLGITWIAAVILAYVKQDDAKGTWVESHLRWQIRTFWYGLLWFGLAVAGWFATAMLGGLLGLVSGRTDAVGWGAAGGAAFGIAVGIVIGVVSTIWVIYRIVKGWLRLAERREVA